MEQPCGKWPLRSPRPRALRLCGPEKGRVCDSFAGAGHTGWLKKWSCCTPSAWRRAIVADDEPAVASGWVQPATGGDIVPPSVMCDEWPIACARPTSDRRSPRSPWYGPSRADGLTWTLAPSKAQGGARRRRKVGDHSFCCIANGDPATLTDLAHSVHLSFLSDLRAVICTCEIMALLCSKTHTNYPQHYQANAVP
eukprot:649998-Prymnesium_polylepis.1